MCGPVECGPSSAEWVELPHPATQSTGTRCHLEHVYAIQHTAMLTCTTVSDLAATGGSGQRTVFCYFKVKEESNTY